MNEMMSWSNLGTLTGATAAVQEMLCTSFFPHGLTAIFRSVGCSKSCTYRTF